MQGSSRNLPHGQLADVLKRQNDRALPDPGKEAFVLALIGKVVLFQAQLEAKRLKAGIAGG